VSKEVKTQELRKAMTKRLIQRRQKQAGNQSLFAEELKLEFKRITWPNQKSVVKASVLIFSIMTISTIMVFGFDIAFSKLFLSIRKLG
jgi:preprotein translocase SecE subunit